MHRDRHIKEVLRPLIVHPDSGMEPYYRRIDRIMIQRRSQSSTYIVGVNEGGPPVSDYREWRFSTIWSTLRASYYERWLLDEQDSDWWYLDRAYLHIYIRDTTTGDDKEYLALHCDPNEPANAEHVEYKKVPHLHIGSIHLRETRSPWPHAHVALSRVELNSMPSIGLVMGWAVKMLAKEVLQRDEVTGFS